MTEEAKNIKQERYNSIILGGIGLLVLTSLLGWSSRSLWVLAIVEGLILSLFLLDTMGKDQKIIIPFSLKLLLFFSFLSTIFSVYLYTSILVFVKLSTFIIAFGLVVKFIKTKKQLKFYGIVLSSAALIAAVDGLVNFFQLRDITLGMASFFGWRNIFAGFILLTLPFTLSLFLTINEKWGKIFYGAVTILLVVDLYFTFSQAAWICFLIAFLGILWFLRKNNKKQLAVRLGIMIIVSGILIIALPHLHSLIGSETGGTDLAEASSIQTFSIKNRVDYWKTSWDIFIHYPWLGVGLGNFKTLYTHFQQNIWSFSISPHNYLLLLLAEYGIFAALTFLAFFFTVLRKGIALARKAENQYRSYAIGLTASIVASFLHALADIDLEIPALLLLLFIEAACLFALAKISSVRSESSAALENRSKPAVIVPFAVFIVLGTVVIISMITNLWNEQADVIQENLTNSQASISILEKAIKLNPLNADLDGNLSESYQLAIIEHSGDREFNQEQSIYYAKKAAELDMLNSERYQSLGYTYNFASSNKDDRIKKSEEALTTAITYNPFNDPYTYQLLGFVLFRQEKYQAAINALDIPLTLYNEESILKIHADQQRLDLIKDHLKKISKFKETVIGEMNK